MPGTASRPYSSVKVQMEYQGKQFTVLQCIDGNWKWLVAGIEGHTKSGTASSRPAGVKAAERAIDKALAPKKKRLRAPGSGEAAN
jgi:hypothetical protein